MRYDDELAILNADEWISELEDSTIGEPIPTILSPFIPPLVKGRTTTLGAETEVGKTAFGLDQWFHAVEMGTPSAYITLEMTPADLFERLSKRFESVEEAKDWIKRNKRLAYVSKPYIDVPEIERIIKSNFDFVILDHIHELPFENHEDLARKVKRIASLAPATNTSILMLSQMKQPDFLEGLPTKYSYSWTKAIPEVSSVLLALYREDEDNPNDLLLLNLKNRFGPKYSPLRVRINGGNRFEKI
jgi:hypothetical protein